MNPQLDTHLRQALLALSADIAASHPPQPGSTLWLRAHCQARRQARRQAIARAAFPLRLMSTIGTLAAALTAAFALYQIWTNNTATPTAIHALLTWTAPAALTIAAGAWLLLRTARTQHESANP